MSDLLKRAEEFFYCGEMENAKYLLLSIVELEPDHVEANNNLGVVYFQLGDADKAAHHLRKALHDDPGYRDALLNYLDLVGRNDRQAEAMPEIEAYLDIHPEDQKIRSLREKALQKTGRPRLKMTILCTQGLENFLPPVEAAARRAFEIRTVYSNRSEEMIRSAEWADIVWIEWANETAVFLSRHPTALKGKRVICRLHSYEAFTPFITQIDWSNIHDLVFVADHLREITLRHHPPIRDRVRGLHVIPSGIPLDRFPYKERVPGRNLAYLGSINYKKGPMLLFHAFASLVRRHPGYHLFVGGDIQDLRYLYYFEQLGRELGLMSQIHFEGRIQDVPRWFEDKHYIVCSSVLESQYLAVMEAMACGIKPLIHNFVGARGIYPEDLLWNTIDDFVALVEKEDYDSRRYRAFIEERYPLQIQQRRLAELFSRLEKALEGTKAEDGRNS